MYQSEYAALDATALAELIREGHVSTGEVRAAAQAAVEAVNPALNAVVGDLLPGAGEHDSAGEFAGVPFALKDLVCHAAGILHESGSQLCQGFVPDYDTDLLRRWRAAGLAIMYRTTTPEFGLSCATESRATGVTRNPWDLERSPGGSSGGSAALVAAGALPWAHANDAAGSNRIPAALCGLVGLKPTRGRIPPGPDADDPLFGTSTEFALTRTVRDTAALLDTVAGPEPGDRFAIERPHGRFRDARLRNGQRLRIAYSSRSPFGGPVDPACTQAVERTAAVLEEMGHELVEDQAPLDPEQFVETMVRFWSASMSETVKAFAQGRPYAQLGPLLQATTRRFALMGDGLRWHDIAQARSWQNHLTRATGRYFSSYDLQLTPTVAHPAWPIGALDPDDPTTMPREWIHQQFSLVPFTALYNVTGQPAISLPAGMAGRLPVGVQLAAPQGREDVLLAVAFALEEARPWAHHCPDVHAMRAPVLSMAPQGAGKH